MKLKSVLIIVMLFFVGTHAEAQTFQDSPSSENEGDFPSKWNLIKGSAQIMSFEGSKVIEISNKGIISPLLNTNNYLADNFTLEFDAYFDEVRKAITYQYYPIRLWSGDGAIKTSTQGHYKPFNILRHGVRVSGRSDKSTGFKHENLLKALESKEALWRNVKVDYNNNNLKIYIDNTLVLNLPRLEFKPSMVSIGAIANQFNVEFVRVIKNVRLEGITTGTSGTAGSSTTDDNNTTSDTTIGEPSENYEYIFPKEDGSANQILETNGRGTLNWVDHIHAVDTPASNGSHSSSEIMDNPPREPVQATEETSSEITNSFGGLEAIDEGNGIGWRLKRGEPYSSNNGRNAIDLSYSIHPGNGIGATGESSFAMGEYAHAQGDYAIAMGRMNGASGESSLAAGYGSKAIGKNSVAIGYTSVASGDNSFALGNGSKATKKNAVSIGNITEASGEHSLAMGKETKASGAFSIAIGRLSNANGVRSIAIGDNTEAGNYATALGYSTKASGDFSTAMGRFTKAYGVRSTAMGDATEAGNYATAIGNRTKANGENSTAMGYETTALGGFSTAIGNRTKAKGDNSMAMGYETTALGDFSTAMGERTRAASAYSLVIGRYNIGEGSPNQWIETDPLFEIGTGDWLIPSNALTVLKNGNMGITTHTPQVKLHITGGTDASLNTGGYVIIGDKHGENLVFDNNEVMARNNVHPATLYLQHNGGDVFVGGKVVHSSDKRLKQDIENLAYGLKEVLQLRPVSYHWKSNPVASEKSIGLIAQEVQPLLSELITTNRKNKNTTLGVNYTELIPILIKALQEQQVMIENQNKKIDDLSSLNLRLAKIETLLKNEKL